MIINSNKLNMININKIWFDYSVIIYKSVLPTDSSQSHSSANRTPVIFSENN